MEEQVECNELFSLVGGVYISKLGGKPLEILFSIKLKHCLRTFPQKKIKVMKKVSTNIASNSLLKATFYNLISSFYIFL